MNIIKTRCLSSTKILVVPGIKEIIMIYYSKKQFLWTNQKKGKIITVANANNQTDFV